MPIPQQCIAAIDTETPKGAWELIVVDNGSTDDTGGWLSSIARRNGELRVVRNDANLGFGGACNQGMALARGDGIVLLNNDAIVLGEWLEGLWAPLLADSDAGMSSPITNFGRASQVRSLPEPRDGEDAYAMIAAWKRTHAGVRVATDVLSGFASL